MATVLVGGAEPAQRIAVIGAGLAGSLAALALARGGAGVTLLGPSLMDPAELGASGLSYGGLAGRAPARHWRRLERCHGPLGWRPSGLVLHGPPWPRSALSPALLALLSAPLPFSRVDGIRLAEALPAILRAAGVERLVTTVHSLEPAPGCGWRLRLGGGQGGTPAVPPELGADRVLLAAGAGCRSLWPALPSRLRVSWAGVLHLPSNPGGNGWLEQVRRGRIVQPAQWQRPTLEHQAGGLAEERWIVDAGLAPSGEGVLLGQISLVRPGLAVGDPPDPGLMEERLRQGLSALDQHLAAAQGTYRQVPVPFCTDGQPLVGPVAQADDLWVFTGFRGAFSLVPQLAEQLAPAMLGLQVLPVQNRKR